MNQDEPVPEHARDLHLSSFELWVLNIGSSNGKVTETELDFYNLIYNNLLAQSPVSKHKFGVKASTYEF